MLSKYAEEELNRALNDTLGPLVRAMVLKAEVMANPLANTTGHQGYTEPEKEVMHQVVTFLTGKVSAFSVTPADEPVLSLTGFPAVALAHMDHDAASTPGERKVWQEKIRQREADLKARGCCHDALSVLQKVGACPHLPLSVGERQTALSPVHQY